MPVTAMRRAGGVLEQILASLLLSVQFLTNVSVIICFLEMRTN